MHLDFQQIIIFLLNGLIVCKAYVGALMPFYIYS